MEIVRLKTETIKLDQFIKWMGITATGAEAKQIIRQGMVKVNGEVETRRGKKLKKDDVVEVAGKTYKLG
ncbi:MAG: RNA-binding S4 domain-containing protein [Clostridiaceae bacterium]|nr:RNA-binding S4 domain-containing protein [Clostridiaceae bacterium]